MKNEKDLYELDQKIKNELGIDVSKYKNEEAVEKISELLLFPKYAINWTLRPILLALLVFFIGYFIFDFVYLDYIFYTVFGFLLFLLTGLFSGLLLLIWKIKNDLKEVLEYSFDIFELALLDTSSIKSNLQLSDNSESKKLLFQGIIHIVMIPLISRVIGNKIPLIGGFLESIIIKVFSNIAGQINFNQIIKTNINQNIGTNKNDEGSVQSTQLQHLKLEKIINIAFRIAQFPIKILFFLSIIFLVILIYFIN